MNVLRVNVFQWLWLILFVPRFMVCMPFSLFSSPFMHLVGSADVYSWLIYFNDSKFITNKHTLNTQYSPICFTRLCCCFAFQGVRLKLFFEWSQLAVLNGQYWVFKRTNSFHAFQRKMVVTKKKNPTMMGNKKRVQAQLKIPLS